MSTTFVNETHTVGKRITFVWKINDFSTCPLAFEEPLRSGNFGFQDGTYFLEAYWHSISSAVDHTGKDIYLFVKVKCISITFETLVCAFDDMIQSGIYNPKCSQILQSSNESQPVGLFSKYQLETNRSLFLKSADCLTIVCKLMNICIKQDFDVRATSYDYQRLGFDLKNLLRSKENSDVKLLVKGTILHAHSVILRARSPVFAKMLKQEREERRSWEFEISDSTANAMRSLLHYLYTCELSEMNSLKDLLDLYRAAGKYNLAELKHMCSRASDDQLSEETIVYYATWANEHGDQSIMDHVVRFYAKSKGRIGGDKWKQMLEIIPNLADKVLNERENLEQEYPYAFSF